MPGARCARSLACEIKKHTSVVTTVAPVSPGIPRAMVLTVSFVLSPVIGLVCHRRPRSCLRRLDAGVEASGPHDFAVRISTIRQARFRVHRIPPHVGDVRNAPLPGQDGASGRFDLPDGESEIFLQMGLDRFFAKQPDGQITWPPSPRPACGERSKPKRSEGFG